MALIKESVVRWYLEWKDPCLELVYHGRDLVMTNQRQWAAGCMGGFSVAASILLSIPSFSMVFPSAAIIGFLPSVWLYSSQNSKEIIRFIVPTSLTLLAITVFVFHGLGSMRTVLTYLPMFISATLITTVTITPPITVLITSLGEGIFAWVELGRSFGPIRNQGTAETMDVERLANPFIEMSGPQTMEFRRPTSFDSIEEFIQRLPDARILESQDQAIDESIDLDVVSSQSTTTEVRELLEQLNENLDISSQVPVFIPISPLDMDPPITIFPNAPQDLVLRSYSPGSTSSSRIEEPNPEEDLIPL